MAEQNPGAGKGPQGPGYERRDVNVRMIMVVSVIITLIFVIAIWLIYRVYQTTQEDLMRQEVVIPQEDSLRQARQEERAPLYERRLVDSAQGIYSIPIDSAIRLMVERADTARISSGAP